MKRVILIGVAILFATSMTMAADLIVNGGGTISGSYDNVRLDTDHGASVAGSYTYNLDADLTASADLSLVDTATAGVDATLNVSAGRTVSVDGSVIIGGGGHAELNVEGTMNVAATVNPSWFNYDGINEFAAGVSVDLNVSGQLNYGGHLIMGGYVGNMDWNITASGDAEINGGYGGVLSKPTYVGCVSGNATMTMTGSAKYRNLVQGTNYYDNSMSVGWQGEGTEATLSATSGCTIQFQNISIKPYGTYIPIMDAAGGACLLDVIDPIDPATGEPSLNDGFLRFDAGSIIDLDWTATNAALLIPGFAVDIGTATEDWMLQWEDGDGGGSSYIASLANDDMYGAYQFRLREKPGDASTLQAYIIPEPTTLALLGLGGLLVALRRRS